MPTSTSNIVVKEEAKQRDKARALTDQSGAALGELRAFGDVLGTISRDQARDAGAVGQIGGFKSGSSGVLPFELDEAGRAGDGMKLFGDILGGAGSVATGAGLSGGGLHQLPTWLGGGTPGAMINTTTGGLAPFPAQASKFLRLGNLYGGV